MTSPIPPFARINRVVLVIAIVCLVTTFAGVIFVAARHDDRSISGDAPNPPATDPSMQARVASRFGRLPLNFEVNQGQVEQPVKFVSHGPGYHLFLTANEAVLTLRKPRAPSADTKEREGSVLRLKMIGANAAPHAEGQDELPGKVNYFIGNDPEKWRRNVPTYRKVYYKDVYPGIDVVYYGNQRELEYDFVVAPGANPKLIKFTVEGADKISLDQLGNLLLNLKHGEVRLHKPVIYQLTDAGRREVKGEYVIKRNEIRFNVQAFDSGKPLIIDPVLSYSTFLGGAGTDAAFAIAIDSQGSAYVTGFGDRLFFPTTPGAFKTTTEFGGTFISKLDPTGSTLVYSTFLSGGNSSSSGRSIAVDSSGNAYVTGSTSASDFPIVNGLKTTTNFYKTTDSAANWHNNITGLSGEVSAIAIAKNAPNIMYAGALGGIHRSTDSGLTWTKTPGAGLSISTFATALAVDPTNSSVVYAGFINGGLFKTTDAGNNWSVISSSPLNFFVVFSIVFDPATPATIYVGTGNGAFKTTDSGSTWTAINNFGTQFPPNVRSLAIDPTAPSTIYAGTLGNGGFFKSTNGGSSWTVMNSGMGGGNPGSVTSVVIDPSDPSIIYTGHSSGGINKSTNGATSWTPVNNGVSSFTTINTMVATASAVYAATDGGTGVIKTTNGGTNWTSANLGLGGSQVRSLVVHPTDPTILFAGTTANNFQDAFVTKLNSSGSGLLFSTLLGGSGNETGNDIAVDGNGNIYVVGETVSTNFPVVNAMQSASGPVQGCGNGFVTKIDPAAPAYVFSTYLGGSGCDLANSVALDQAASVYVTGTTGSTDFPVANAFQSTRSGLGDAFVTKLTSSGSLAYSTYLGGSNSETGHGITVDSTGDAFVTGITTSSNFPTLNAFQSTGDSVGGDVFVTQLNSLGSGLVYSTFLGGENTDTGRGIAVDAAGNAYVTGFTNSLLFPLTQGALRTKSPMYKSLDGAANWSNDNYGTGAAQITHVLVHPTQPSTVYIGTALGVFRSTNGGRNWSPINNGLEVRRVIDIVIDPSTPSNIYVATNDFFGGPANGVYKSIDGGNSWTLRKNGMVNNSVLSLAIDPVTPTTLYAGVSGGPVYKTTDGADNWSPTGTGPLLPTDLAVDPLNPTTVYAAQVSNGIFKSADSGATWHSIGSNQTGSFVQSISVSPFTPGLLYADAGVGLLKSTDGGDNWSPVITNPAGIRGKVVFDPVSPSTYYLLDSSPFFPNTGLHKSIDNGQTWFPVNKGLHTQSAVALAINPLQPSILHLVSAPSSGDDAFVVKINPSGNGLIYSTLLGGAPGSSSVCCVNAQAFGIAVDSGGNAYVTGLVFSLNFPTTPNSFQPFLRGFNDAFITKLASSYIISGHVLDGTNAPIAGVEVVLTDGSSITSFITETDGSYEFARLREGGNFTVTATKPGFTMAPPSQTFNNLSSDQVLNFTATATNAPFFTISGQITENGNGLPGVTVTLSGSQPGLRTTDSNGNYSFELAGGGNYTVTPSGPGFTFATPSQTFNSLSASQTANFVATRQSFVVTNDNNHGAGSLRDAIINANATAGRDTITFNIPGPGVKTIKLLTPLPEMTDQVVIDATTQPGYAGSPLIELDGTTALNANGLVFKAGGSTVKGLAFGNFNNAIWLNGGSNNVVQGNYIGIDPTGTTVRANNTGVFLNNSSSNNLIGGTTAAARNVISGNRFRAVELGGNGNTVQGNFIGTNPAGTATLNNDNSGISIPTAEFTDNVIGGTAPGAGNLISGNDFGIRANGPGTIIQGNLIGTDITGTKRLPNGTGISAFGANILIGGQTPAARNLISGNDGDGVTLNGNGSRLEGNFVGTDITGTLVLHNSTGVNATGHALVGGTVPEARNVIAGNSFANVLVGFNSFGSAATVQGNYIGTDVTGTKALSPDAVGVSISDVNCLIGGTAPGAGNVISGNRVGIQVGGIGGPQGHIIQGNLIGLNALGSAALSNTFEGIVMSGSMSNVIGGTQSGAANKIAFNGGAGISIHGDSRNSIRGNSIFSNGGLGIDLGGDGLTVNDTTDSDPGANLLQNFPVLTSVQSSSGSTTIQGSLKSTPNTTFQIDFYSNAAIDPSGNGEGALFFNTTSVTTNGSGDATINVTFSDPLPVGRAITATATDPDGNTSEFSAGDETAASGSVRFNLSAFFVIEDVGLATITVQRTGGSLGNLSVDYATADGTAIAGQDYTSTSGTLNFGNGETTKTFQIPITEDAVTEPDETFTVTLRTSSLEALGAPNTMLVTIQDRTTVPFLFMARALVVEGNPGTTTQVLFTLTLSAATGRTVSVNYATANGTATGGAACGGPGIDYESVSGTVTFQPGQFSTVIPVTVCGDNSAESNEFFVVNLSNASNATIPLTEVVGMIVNDDVLELILEESGPGINQAAALEAALFVRDPFHIMRLDEWIPGGDRNTRVVLFARNLILDPGEPVSAVIVRLIGSNNQAFNVPAEDVRAVPNTEFTQVVIRLPDNLPSGTCTLTIRAHGRISNIGSFRIAP